jgi:hypothetical protein
MARSMKAVAEHKAPVPKAVRINFVILPSKFLLHATILLVEINCMHDFRKRGYTFKEKVRAK